MKIPSFHAARACLLVALPLSAIAASAQNLRSSVTTFDQNGNAIIVPTAGDENRSSVTTFDRNGVPKITYTSPPSTPYLGGIQQPQSIAGLIANQNLYGQSAPNPNPGGYTRFNYNSGPIYPPGYYPYQQPGYAYPAPGYAYPAPGYGYPAPGYAYPTQQSGYSLNFNDSNRPWTIPNNVTSIPLSPGYGGYGYQQGYPVPAYPSYPYPYPAPGYAYPAPGYSYGYGNYGYPGGYHSSNSAGYGLSFGRGGFRASIGGSNTSSRSSSTTTITTR